MGTTDVLYHVLENIKKNITKYKWEIIGNRYEFKYKNIHVSLSQAFLSEIGSLTIKTKYFLNLKKPKSVYINIETGTRLDQVNDIIKLVDNLEATRVNRLREKLINEVLFETFNKLV